MLRWQHSVSHLFSVRSPVITAGDDSLHLFCILLLFGLHLGGLSLKFQLFGCLSPLRAAAASHVSRQSNTSTNATRHDTVGPVVLITWEPSPLPQETLSGFNAALDLVWLSDYNMCEAEWCIELRTLGHNQRPHELFNFHFSSWSLVSMWVQKTIIKHHTFRIITHWTDCIKYTEVIH